MKTEIFMICVLVIEVTSGNSTVITEFLKNFHDPVTLSINRERSTTAETSAGEMVTFECLITCGYTRLQVDGTFINTRTENTNYTVVNTTNRVENCENSDCSELETNLPCEKYQNSIKFMKIFTVRFLRPGIHFVQCSSEMNFPSDNDKRSVYLFSKGMMLHVKRAEIFEPNPTQTTSVHGQSFTQVSDSQLSASELITSSTCVWRKYSETSPIDSIDSPSSSPFSTTLPNVLSTKTPVNSAVTVSRGNFIGESSTPISSSVCRNASGMLLMPRNLTAGIAACLALLIALSIFLNIFFIVFLSRKFNEKLNQNRQDGV